MRRLLLAVTLLALVACTQDTPTVSSMPTPTQTSPTSTSTSATPKAGAIVERPVARGLDHPATFVFDRSGAIFYGERLTGEIRRIDPTTGKNTSVFTIPGVVGVTLPPSFPAQPWLYAYATRKVHGVARDQILRLRWDGDRVTSMQVLLDVEVAGVRHNGGRMLFGPDGMLYVVVGETMQSDLAQDR